MISIALIDDSEQSASLLKILAQGHSKKTGIEVQVRSFTSGFDFLKELKAGIYYDCVVMDVCMPSIDGPSLFDEIIKNRFESVLMYYTALLGPHENRLCMISKTAGSPLISILETYEALKGDKLSNMLKMSIRTDELRQRNIHA